MSNTTNRIFTHQYANQPDIGISPEDTQKAMKQYTLGQGLNVAVRNTDLKIQQCLKGTRLVRAAIALSTKYDLPDNTTNDQPIAYDIGGKASSKTESGTPIRLAQVAAALRNNPIFYPTNPSDPKSECTYTKAKKPMTLDAAIKATIQNANISDDKGAFIDDVLTKLDSVGPAPYAQTLYKNLPLVDTGSTSKLVTVINIDAQSQPEPTEIPQAVSLNAAHGQSVKYVAATRVGYKQELIEHDPCATPTENETMDEKAPLSFWAQVLDYFKKDHWVNENSETAQASVTIKETFSPQISQTIDTTETAYQNFLTRKQINKVKNSPDTTTSNKITTDPNVKDYFIYQANFYTIDQQKELGIYNKNL